MHRMICHHLDSRTWKSVGINDTCILGSLCSYLDVWYLAVMTDYQHGNVRALLKTDKAAETGATVQRHIRVSVHLDP